MTTTGHLSEELEPHEAERFHAFVESSAASSYLQSPQWPRIAPATKLQRFFHLTCEEDGELAVAGIARFTRLAPGRHLASFQRGPVFREPAAFERCLPELARVLREAGACTCLVNPRWEDDKAELVCGALERNGFVALPPDSEPQYRSTGLVDLTPSEDELLAGFKRRCRRFIRSATKKGLVVRPARDEADAARFQQLFGDFAVRKGYGVDGQPSVLDQWRVVKQQGGVFLLAEIEDELVGGHVVFRESKRAFWMTLASSDRFPDIPRSYNLLWEAMREMKRQGCTSFDMAGFPPDEPRDEAERKRMYFKQAFEPRRVKLVPMHSLALRPLSHALLFGSRQMYRRNERLQALVAPLLRGS